MTQAQAQALAKMHAANAALTPEQRKARSAKAAAAAAEKARTVGAAQAGNAGSERPTSTTKARVEPEVLVEWDVCLLQGADELLWVRVEAAGIRRAMRGASKAHPGTKAQGAMRAGVLKLA